MGVEIRRENVLKGSVGSNTEKKVRSTKLRKGGEGQDLEHTLIGPQIAGLCPGSGDRGDPAQGHCP